MRRLKNPLVAGGLVVLLVGLACAAYRLGWTVPLLTGTLDSLERKSLDWRFELRGPRPAGDEVVVLAFDDRTMQADPGLFELRDGWVRLLEALSSSGARVIGVDALFVDPERLLAADLQADIAAFFQSSADLGDEGGPPERSLLRRVFHATQADQRLVAAIRRADKVVLGMHLGHSGQAAGQDPALSKAAYGQAVPGGLAPPEFDRVVASLPALNAAARALGVISVSHDSTNSVRQLTGVRRVEGAYLMPLAVQLVAVYRGLSKGQLVYLGTGPDGSPALRLGSQAVGLTLDHQLWLNYRGGPGTFATHSVIDLISGRLPADALRDRIVLVGFTYFGHDVVATPFSRVFSGVEVHATAVDNLLRGDFIKRSSWWLDLLICLGFGLTLVLLYWPRLGLGPLAQAGLSLVLLFGYLGISVWLFVDSQVWLLWIGPLVQFFFVSLVCLSLSYLSEGLQRRKLRHAFAHYLADDVIEQLIQRPEALKLGSERRELTVLFSDIRGFTTISEGLAPEALTELLNGYLTPMTEIVFSNRGLLDKYMGDAIMAIFGAPVPYDDHAAAACETALQMHATLDVLRPAWQARGLPGLDIGIGINTGPMSVGNMGSAGRFDYTVLGDNVNLGSRLEGLNKQFQTRVIVGQATRDAAVERFTFRELDRVAVKGKREPATIYELRHRGPAEPGDFWLSEFEQAQAAYRAQRFGEARAVFERLSEQHGDPPSRLAAQRCQQMETSPPGPDWDGVFRATSK